MQVVETFVIMYGHVWMEDEVKVEQYLRKNEFSV
jgi:hypothetical protein